MTPRKKLKKVPDNQLRLIPLEMKHRETRTRTDRLDNLEERVTRLEADQTLIRGQLEREEYIIDDDDEED